MGTGSLSNSSLHLIILTGVTDIALITLFFIPKVTTMCLCILNANQQQLLLFEGQENIRNMASLFLTKPPKCSMTHWITHLTDFFSFFPHPLAYSPPMENHLLSGNNGTLEYKTSLPPISPGRYSPIPKHMLVEDDYTRSDLFIG